MIRFKFTFSVTQHVNMIPDFNTNIDILAFLKSDRDDKISENNDPVNRNVSKQMELLIEEVA